jgi:hypothetical protein
MQTKIAQMISQKQIQTTPLNEAQILFHALFYVQALTTPNFNIALALM